MTSRRWERLEEVFARALELDGAARATFLVEACAGDDELRAEVESLLDSTRGAGDSLRGVIASAAASLAGATTASRIGETIGAYRVIEVIGEGGMGTVYLAERADDAYRGRVAIKILRDGLSSPELVARFRDERQLLAALDHPGIVRLLDGGRTDDGRPYLVMEYVDGVPLARFAGALPVRARVELVVRVAAALQHAHQQLVVHRDVKPSNIRVDARGVPKLLDFGIAKLLGDAGEAREARTRTGMTMFTIEYASPEQARGEPASVATDVYSLGAVLYDLLAGRPPQAAGASAIETLANICEREPPRPSVIAPAPIRRALAGDLDNIVLRALQKDPSRRYATMAAFADDLGRYLAGLPVHARDASLGYRAGKFVRRHRGKLALAALIAGGLAAATAISIVQARRATREAAQAEREKRALLVERGWQEVMAGRANRALPYLVEALREGEDTPALRFLIAEARRPLARVIRAIPFADGAASIAWSPDGSRIAVGTMTAGALLDGDGARIASLDTGGGMATALAWSADGAQLAVSVYGGHTRVFDGRSGAPIATTPSKPGAFTLAFTRGGGELVGCGAAPSVGVWDARSGAPIAATPARAPLFCALSPDDRHVAIGDDDGAVWIWDRGGAEPPRRLGAHGGAVWALRFSRDGRRLYTSAWDGTARIWDVDAGTAIAVLAGHGGPVFNLDLDRDDTHLLTGSEDGTAKIWDARSGKLLTILAGHRAALHSARFSPDGRQVVTAGADATFRVWDAATGDPQILVEAAEGAGDAPHSWSGTFDASFSPDGTRLLTGASKEVGLGRDDRAPLVAELTSPRDAFTAGFSADESRLAVGGDRLAEIWDRARGARLVSLDVGETRIYDAGWSPDGHVLFAGSGGFVRIYDGSGVLVRALVGHDGMVNRAAWSRDGGRVLTAGDDRTARVWDAATGAPVLVLRHPDRVMSASWSSDGARIATAGWDHRLRVWDARTGALVATIDAGPAQLLDVQWRHDGRALVAAGHGGEVGVWDLATGARTLTLEGHTAAVTSASWSPDDALLATSADDGTARVWDPDTGRLLAVRRARSGVMSLAWSRDGAQLLAASIDQRVRIWDVHRDADSAAALADFVARRVPFRLVGARLERAAPPR